MHNVPLCSDVMLLYVKGIIEKAREFQKKSTSAALTMLKSLAADHNKLWKTPQEMGIPDHLTCLLRNLYAGEEETIGPRH